MSLPRRPSSRAEVREERLTAELDGEARSQPWDLARQIAVGAAVAFAVVMAFVGSGIFGGEGVRGAQGGALDADATVLAPGPPAFAIWSVTYLGLIGYAVWQALPAQRGVARQRSLGWWIAGSAALSGLWLIAALWISLLATAVVIVLLLVVLAETFRRVHLTAEVRSSWADLLLVDGVIGVYLGWVLVATLANLAAWAVPMLPPDSVTPAALAALGIVLVLGLAVSGVTSWRVSPPWAMAWGVAWIGVERLAGAPSSVLVGWTAVGVAVMLFAVPLVLRLAVALRSGD